MKRLATFILSTFLAFTLTAAKADSPNSLTGIDAEIWSGLKNTNWIQQGKGERVIYAFIDTNCTYCRALFKKAQTELQSEHAQIRWIPVQALTETAQSSRNGAAKAIEGGYAALAMAMKGNTPPGRPSSQEFDRIDENDRFLSRNVEKYVQSGVPKVIYIKDGGKEVRVFTGLPPAHELNKIFR